VDVWRITWFTLVTAGAATALMVPPGLGLAWVLARKRFRGRVLLDTAVSLPLVMPPVATGLILLTLFAPLGPIGSVLERAGIQVVFTWRAVVLAMTIMGLPLVVRTVRAGFEQVDQRFEAAAATLGAGPLRVFLTVTLPLARPAIVSGAVLGFARAIGEFGAIVIVAGNIPLRTQTAAVYVLGEIESENRRGASSMSIVMLAIAFGLVVLVDFLQRKRDDA